MSKTTQSHREKLTWFFEQPVDVKFEILKNHLEMSRLMVNQIMEDIVQEKTGERYEHSPDGPKSYYRHGFNPGSVKLKDQRLPIQIPPLGGMLCESPCARSFRPCKNLWILYELQIY